MDPFISESRRDFLRSGATLALSLGVPWLAGCTQLVDHRLGIWDELASRLQGSVLRPGSSEFFQRASPWLLQYAKTVPQGIAQCRSESDVVTCIQWAKANNVPLVARSGGHSLAGFSTTTGLMIDVSAMTDFAYDPATGRATVGCGIRNQGVKNAFKPLNRAFTHGRCLSVGVAGLVLGGGIGFDMRSHGYTCDWLRETRIVLADGRVLTCNENQNSDLFWACRGAGGGNFGIHTSFTFETFPVGQVTVCEIEWTERIPETLTALLTMSQSAPTSLGVQVSIEAKKKDGATMLTLSMLGQLMGPVAELEALLAPVLAVQRPHKSDMQYVPYWEGQEFLAEIGAPNYSQERSRFIKQQLTPEAIQFIINSMTSWPGTSKAAAWTFFLLGGKIDAHKPTDMAFVHRGYPMLSSIDLEWSLSDGEALIAQNHKWLTTFHDQLEKYSSSACYQNFIDPSQENYLQAYYGQNLAQLQTVKRKYDPGNLFNYPQSIPV
jgi:hypothetical protein